MNIGFIGLGIMGAPMALHLLNAGHTLFVQTRGRVPEAVAASTARVCANAAEVARQAEVIFTMVPDTPDVEAVLFGENGVAAGLKASAASAARQVVVDLSSISPMATKTFAQRINALGADYIDAPVSGGEVGAKAASLTIMCGGDAAVFERVRPLLEKMGKNITLVGSNGDGQTTKVANQIIVALNIAAVGEALLFASKAGADPAKVRQALMGGFAASRILEVHGERMIKRTFNPGFRIKLHQKDLNLALQGARELGVALPQTAGAAQLMGACIRMHERDNVAIVANDGGLEAGTALPGGPTLREHVPQGHKVALVDIAAGTPVLRYGVNIGLAAQDIAAGGWVHERLLQMPAARGLEDLPLATSHPAPVPPLEGYSFEGYRNADGSVGTRNILAITQTVQCVAGVTAFAVQRIKAELLPKYPQRRRRGGAGTRLRLRRGHRRADAVIPIRTLRHISQNPNFGGEVMVVSLGCEKLQPERLLPPGSIALKDARGQPGGALDVVCLQDDAHVGFMSMVDHIVRQAEAHLSA
jgi:2-hydroxy-3-oxopropionate reductase